MHTHKHTHARTHTHETRTMLSVRHLVLFARAPDQFWDEQIYFRSECFSTKVHNIDRVSLVCVVLIVIVDRK